MSCIFKNCIVVRHFGSAVQDKYTQRFFLLGQHLLQRVFLQTPGLPHQPFDAVALHCFFKMPGGYTHTSLQNTAGIAGQPVNPEGEIRKTFSFLK